MTVDLNDENPIEIKIEIAEKINYAAAQWMSDTGRGNVLNTLQIANGSDRILRNCKLKIWTQPPFISSRSWSIDEIPSGQTFAVADLKVQLDGGFLWSVAEAMSGTVHFELRGEGFESVVQNTPIRLLKSRVLA